MSREFYFDLFLFPFTFYKLSAIKWARDSVRIFEAEQNYIKEWYELHATNSCNWNVNQKTIRSRNQFFPHRSEQIKIIGEHIFGFSCVQFLTKVKIKCGEKSEFNRFAFNFKGKERSQFPRVQWFYFVRHLRPYTTKVSELFSLQ